MNWLNEHLNWWTATLAATAILAIGYVVSMAIVDDIERDR